METKDCPKCGTPHSKPGTFCSRTCANSRTFSAESRRKKSIAMRGRKPAMLAAMSDPQSPARAKWLQHIKAISQEKYRNTPFEKLGKDSKRRRVLEEQNLKCANCGAGEWLGVSLTLEIDHIDGNNQNDSRQNLRGVCPNCHSLTKNWRGRNRKNNTVTDDELFSAIKNTGNICSGLRAVGMTPKGRNYNRAKRVLEIRAPGVAPGSQN